MRLSPSASSASTPPSRRPLITASSRYMSMPLAPALQPHVRPADEVVVLEFRRRSGEPDAPDLKQIGTVDDVEHLLDVLLDDQHGQPFAADALDQVEHLLDDER